MTSHRTQPPPEKRRRRRYTDLERLRQKYEVDAITGCWNWTACKTPAGYGQFWFEYRRNNFAHRAAYILLVGPIPDGKVLDHLCRNRACCNPAHLEPVTMRENLHRGDAPSMKAHREGVCPNGHPYTPDNLYERPSGGRTHECLTCRRTYKQRRFTAVREAEVVDLPYAAEDTDLFGGAA